jgi:hypothetical protein
MRIHFAIAALVLLSVGCQGTGLPDLAHPGSASEQLRKSQRYDVYPEQEIAPAVDGGRPPGMDKSWPEPTRSRYHFPNGRF